jgi:hypothetical protein
MRGIVKTRGVRAAVLVSAVSIPLVGAGCGGDDFENEPRPPVTLQLSGVITDSRVTVSPDSFRARPVTITVSNQTEDSHTVMLTGTDCKDAEGQRVDERVGPINPLDTATLQKTLGRGRCEVRAGSEKAVDTEIAPARLVVKAPDPDDSAKDKLLLP